MRVVVCSHSRAAHHQRAAKAFAAGLARHGVEHKVVVGDAGQPADLYVVWGHRRGQIFDRQKREGRHYLVMERGYFRDRFAYTSLGYDGLNGRADFCNADVPGDRWEKHGVPLAPWRNPRRGYVLLLGQVYGDASLAGVHYANWLRHVSAQLRAMGREVVFRPHPLAPSSRVERVQVVGGTLAEAFAGARCALTYNSNSGVDAVLAGVPLITTDRGSMAWDVAAHSLLQVDDPPTPDREAWAHRLAYCQWTEAEITSGEAWDHLRRKFAPAPTTATPPVEAEASAQV